MDANPSEVTVLDVFSFSFSKNSNPIFWSVLDAAAAADDAERILETCQTPIHHAPGLEYIAEETPRSDFMAYFGSGSGLKMLLEAIRSILTEYQPVISILDPF